MSSRKGIFSRWSRSNSDSSSKNKPFRQPPEALLTGSIIYKVKFMGFAEVDQPKGPSVVRDAITKLKFSKEIQKSSGVRAPKVELAISAKRVGILDPKTKAILHRFPLHRVSYCADDKTDKRIVAFVVKENDEIDSWNCYVVDTPEKCGEEITTTIGQAFDLAYRTFMQSTGRDMETKKQYLLLKKQVHELKLENQQLKKRIAKFEGVDVQDDVTINANTPQYDVVGRTRSASNTADISYTVPTMVNGPIVVDKNENVIKQTTIVAADVHRIDDNNGAYLTASTNVEGQKKEQRISNLEPLPELSSINPEFSTNISPQSPESVVNKDYFIQPISPPPPAPARRNRSSTLSATPSSSFATAPSTPFSEEASFNLNESTSATQLDKQIHLVDSELIDLKVGFSHGLTMGQVNLEDLDPLNTIE